MFFHHWLQELAQRWSVRGGKRRRRAGRASTSPRRRVRPRLEVLEDRITPSYDVLKFSAVNSFTPIAPNQPSGAISVQLQDANGNAITATSNVTVQLSGNSSTGAFLDLSGKPLSNNSIVIPSGSNFSLFEYEDSQSGEMTVKGLSTNPLAFGGMNVNVQNRLVFTTPSQSIAPGAASQPITVQLQDANGNAIEAASNVTLTLNGNSSTGKFLDTSGNALTNNSITIAAGASSASFEFEDSQAEDTGVAASMNSGVFASQTEHVGYSLAFTTPVQVIAANQRSGPITIQLQDSSGKAIAAASALTIRLNSSDFSEGQFFDTSGNLLPSNSGFFYNLTVAAGASSASFEYQEGIRTAPTITAQAVTTTGGNIGASVRQGVYVGVPLVITTPAQLLTPGKPSQPITIQLDSAPTSEETIDLSSSSGTGRFLDTSGNPLPGNSITIAAGSSAASFEYEDSTTGLPTITAKTSDGSATWQQQESVGVSVNFTTTPQTVAQDRTSGTITVQLQDSSGNPFTVADNTVVQLSSTDNGLFFDKSGNQLFGSVTIAAGSSSASFEYESTSPSGTQTLTATLTPFNNSPSLISATQQETVISSPLSSLYFISPAQTIAPNQPSQPFTVQLQNSFSAATATSNVAIQLSSSSSTGKFLDTSGNALANNSITIAAGASSASFEYKDSQEWLPTLTATVSGNSAVSEAQQEENIGGVSLAFSTAAQTTATSQPSGTITVQLQDSDGNAVAAPSAVSINLSSLSKTGQFLDTTGKPLSSPTVTIAAGTSSASFEYEDTVGGTPTLRATPSIPTVLSVTQQETVTGAYGVELVPSGLAQNLGQSIALNQPSQPIFVHLQDSLGLPITAASAVTVSLSSTSSGGMFLDTSGKPLTNNSITIPAGSSEAEFEYEDSQAGLPTLTASENGFTSTQQEVVGLKLAFTTAPQTLATGQTSQPLTVQLQDSNGNAFTAPSALTLNLFGTANLQFLDTSGNPLTSNSITIAAGASSASFEFESALGGGMTVTADYGLTGFGGQGFSALLSASQQETVQGLSTLAFTTSKQTVTAGQMSGTVTVQLEDNNGNPANAPSGGLTINLSSGSPISSPASTIFFDANGNPLPTNQSNVAAITMPAGSSTVSFTFQSTQAGAFTLFANASGMGGEQGNTVQATSPSSVVFTTPTQSLVASTPSGSITVQLEDKYGNVISTGNGGLTFNLSSSSTGGQFLSVGGDPLASPSITIPQGESSATFEYEDSQSGTPTLTVTASGISGKQQETIAATSTSIHVTNTNDSGDGSLRAAIDAANTNLGGTIIFDSGVSGTIDLLTELPNIAFNTNIIGPGADKLTIERSSTATGPFGGLTIGFAGSFAPPEPTVTISGLTLTNFDGTGINNYGALTLRQVEVSNTQVLPLSGIDGAFLSQGGITNNGTLTVLDSTIADNAYSGIYGGSPTVINSTITGNTGGGITSFGTAYIASTTISGNTDTNEPEFGLIHSFNNFAGGITGGATLYNTIVAGNTGPTTSGFNGATNSNDVVGGFVSLGNNLIGQADSSSSGFVSTDLVGTTSNPIDPKLGALANNGGPTPTMALLTGSPALAAGSSANAPATDQRGDARPSQGAIDIGAVEQTVATNPWAPSVTTNPQSQSVTVGDNVSFTAAASGNPNPTVQWMFSTGNGNPFTNVIDGLNVSGAKTTTLTLSNVTAAMNGYEYEAVFSNGVGNPATTNAATLTVTTVATPPTITTQPSNATVADGGTATFKAAANGSPTPAVQWMFSTGGSNPFTILNNGNGVSGATTPTLTLSNVTTAMNGYRYEAVFQNTAGTVPTNAATLTVTAATLPQITMQPSPQIVTAGQTATFTATAIGNPSPTVHWQYSTNDGKTYTPLSDGLNVSGATSTTLTLRNVTTSMNAYVYQAVFSNSAGQVPSAPAVLGVLPPTPQLPPPPPTLNVPSLLAIFNDFLGGVETINADGTETVTDSFFGFPLLVSTFDSNGNLVSVDLFGFFDITLLFLFV